MRSIGGTPTARCRSEQPCATPSLRNASILAITSKATCKRLDFRVFVATKGNKRELRLSPGVQQSDKAPLQELFERYTQFVHRLRALGLVQCHALHDQAVQFLRQRLVRSEEHTS